MTELLRATHEVGLGNVLAVLSFGVLVTEMRRLHAALAVAHQRAERLEEALRKALSRRKRRAS
ncbi:MAG: hypothetical protein RLZZ200_838 [Pseudomonadota bacterium]|jgi:hypothetical protein